MPGSLTSPDLQKLRRAIRDKICQEADPLTSTVELELPLVVRSEPLLQHNESEALGDGDLRVHDDYRAVLSWLVGGAVPEEAPGVRIPDRASTIELEQGMDLQRELATRQPDVYLPELAASLNNLAATLADRGRHEEAMHAAQEVVSIRRQMAREHPETFERDLASALNSLGHRLSTLGRREDALQASQEAVELYRRLARARPDAFEPDLAMALGARGSIERAMDPTAAAVSFQEGLQVLLPHLRRSTAAFAGLAASLAGDLVESCRESGTTASAQLLLEVRDLLGPPRQPGEEPSSDRTA